MDKILLILALAAATSWGTMHTAASCSLADVTTAYGLCPAGDTLAVPAGSAAWATGLIVSKPITVLGANPTLAAPDLAPDLSLPDPLVPDPQDPPLPEIITGIR